MFVNSKLKSKVDDMKTTKGKIARKYSEEVFKKKSEEIEFPSGIALNIQSDAIVLEKSGYKINIKYNPVYVKLNFAGNKLTIAPTILKKRAISVVNAIAKLVKNAISGFDKEYVYKLAVVYSHFPMNIKAEGNTISVSNFLGEKKPRKCRIMPGCVVEIKGKEIIVKGKDKYNTGQTAGNLEKLTRVTNKDYRIFDDGCYIIERP
jgi:large subunit ribosomal protein L6